MIQSLPFIGRMRGDLGDAVAEQFRWIKAQVVTRWNVNHRSDGTHGPLTIFAALTIGDLAAITPAQLLAAQNNYNPANLARAIVLRLSSDASRNVTGLMAPDPPERRFRLLCNVGAQNIVLVHASASSNLANRFDCPGAGDFTLNTKDSVWIWYDATSLVWRVIEA